MQKSTKIKNFIISNDLFIISLIIIISIILILFILTPIHITTARKNKITKIYFADSISPAHREIIAQFNKKHDGEIEVIPVDLPFSKFSTNERKELLTRSLRGKSDRIDIFAVDLIWVPRFARWCHPLTNYFTDDQLGKIIDCATESCYYKNELVASPFYFDIGLMYYRYDIISTLPDHAEIEKKLKEAITWEDFIELSKNFNKTKYPFYMFSADNFEGLICSFWENILSQNYSVFTGDSIQLCSDKVQKGLQLLVDFVNTYKITPPIATKLDEYQCYTYTLNNDGIFLRGWPGFLKHYKDKKADLNKLKYMKVASLPYFKGTKPVSVYGGWNLMISKFSTKKNEAIQFLKFVMAEQTQKTMFQIGGYLPTNQKIYEDSLFLVNYPELKYYHQLLKRGVHRPHMENYTQISDILSYYIHKAIKKEISVSEALSQATKMINSKKVLIK